MCRGQREDGTWPNYHGGPGDLSTTVEAYVALRLAGDPAGAAHMTRAAQWIRAQEATRGVHPNVDGDGRPVVLGRPARHPAGADLPARVVPA
ncbi:MAG TPA: hypothetical protein VGA04_31330 [Streptosporangiaceae bacterium]